MEIKCLIIEDEPLAREKLEDYIGKVGYLKLVCSLESGLEALGFLKEQKVDLIFLDIQMKSFSGLQFLRSITDRPKVIITTAYQQYALEGYDLEVCDYLLKPFAFERFLKAVEKAVKEISTEKKANLLNSNNKEFIFVKTEYRIEKIRLDEILYIEGLKDYLKIVLTSSNFLTLLSFKKIGEMLPKSEFIRIHKSYIVSLSKIKNIERNRIRINDKLIPISNTYKKQFYTLLKEKKLML